MGKTKIDQIAATAKLVKEHPKLSGDCHKCAFITDEIPYLLQEFNTLHAQLAQAKRELKHSLNLDNHNNIVRHKNEEIKTLEAENIDLRTQLEGTYSKGYSLLQIENPTGRAYVFPYSPREDVFESDTQKWSLVEVNGLKILIAASRITKQIAVGVVDATPM